jgi:hypothetical protein
MILADLLISAKFAKNYSIRKMLTVMMIPRACRRGTPGKKVVQGKI